MQRIPVDSTDIVAIGYDAKERLLEVEFRGARVYQYQDVEPAIYDQFMRAESYGEYFDTHVKRRYRYKKLSSKTDAVKSISLAFVTSNPRKFRDLQLACEPYGIAVEQLVLPVDEIQSHDPHAVTLHKAKQAYALAGNRPVVVNDCFWNILALRGFPGAYMAYVKDWFKPEDFLALMADKKDRSVFCTDTLVYYDGEHVKEFSEDLWGTIIDEPRGEGASIDRVLMAKGETRTVAEIENMEGHSSYHTQGIWKKFATWYNVQRRIGRA